MIAPFIWMLSTALKRTSSISTAGSSSTNYISAISSKCLRRSRSWRVSKTASLWRCRRSSSEPSFRAWPLMLLRKSSSNLKQRSFCCCWEDDDSRFPVIMIPQYYIFTSLDWIGTLYPLIVPETLRKHHDDFLLEAVLAKYSDALIESAKIDGGQPFPDLLEDYPSPAGAGTRRPDDHGSWASGTITLRPTCSRRSRRLCRVRIAESW